MLRGSIGTNEANKRDIKVVKEYVEALEEANKGKEAERVAKEYMSRCPVLQVEDKETYLLLNKYVFTDPYSNVFEYGIYAMKKMNVSARAPHAYLPALLCEQIPSERALALEFGMKLLENCEVLFVCGDRISNGMKGEIGKAASLNMAIIVFDESLYPAVRKLVTQHGGDKAKVTLDEKNAFLSLPPAIINC